MVAHGTIWCNTLPFVLTPLRVAVVVTGMVQYPDISDEGGVAKVFEGVVINVWFVANSFIAATVVFEAAGKEVELNITEIIMQWTFSRSAAFITWML